MDPSPAGRPHLVTPLPGPVAATAEVRGHAVDRELALLAAELGTGRDRALVRALAFYRKFLRRGRRFGQAPETFLKMLLEAFEHRDLHTELARIREKMTALAEGGAGARRAARGKEPSAVEIYRAAKAGRLLPGDTGTGPGSGSGADGPIPDGSRLAGLPLPGTFLPSGDLLPSVGSPPPAAPEAKSDYADRRARLPKITF